MSSTEWKERRVSVTPDEEAELVTVPRHFLEYLTRDARRQQVNDLRWMEAWTGAGTDEGVLSPQEIAGSARLLGQLQSVLSKAEQEAMNVVLPSAGHRVAALLLEQGVDVTAVGNHLGPFTEVLRDLIAQVIGETKSLMLREGQIEIALNSLWVRRATAAAEAQRFLGEVVDIHVEASDDESREGSK